MARTVGQMVTEATAAVPAVSVAEVQRRMQEDPNTLVVDVRDSADARAGGTIPGAINVAYGNLLFAADNEVPEEWRDPSRTYRSFSPAFCAISAEVEADSPRMTSNRPVRWPIEAIKHRAPLLSAVRSCPANASAFVVSNAESCSGANMA